MDEAWSSELTKVPLKFSLSVILWSSFSFYMNGLSRVTLVWSDRMCELVKCGLKGHLLIQLTVGVISVG